MSQLHADRGMGDDGGVEAVADLLQIRDVVGVGVVQKDIVAALQIRGGEVRGAFVRQGALLQIEPRVSEQGLAVGKAEFKALSVDPAEGQGVRGHEIFHQYFPPVGAKGWLAGILFCRAAFP